ncbi:Response regulator receiver domain-containing protein [Carex littledalei]|uniref:Response regulator receiver domain-containing protein n=1 Tax=Carex littledalei TaxID=544730 RepID=A0A833RDZ3_9POAL|nr:Response regulator receiver domain-containing protein [Carex littledalei]
MFLGTSIIVLIATKNRENEKKNTLAPDTHEAASLFMKNRIRLKFGMGGLGKEAFRYRGPGTADAVRHYLWLFEEDIDASNETCIDQNVFRMIEIQQILTTLNFEVVSVQDADEALELLQKQNDFDFIVIDRCWKTSNGMPVDHWHSLL